MKAIIEVDIPDYQIGQEVSIYFKDTMMIKGVVQEPCDDAISRQAVLEYIEGSGAELGHGLENELVCQDIKELPPVIPQPKWIPVSERLPKENGYYLTTTMYHEVYCDYWEEERFNRTETVIAWMPLPEPYKAESEVRNE